jgi:hypothetical protein
MRSAARQPDIARPGQSPESGIAVDLNDALELRQMGDWALGPEIGAMADLDSIDS